MKVNIFSKMRNDSGSALLLVIMIIAIGIVAVSGAIAITVINIQGNANYNEANTAYAIAQSGAEYGILKLLRNPYYLSNGSSESISVNNGTALITVSNTLNSNHTMPSSVTLTSVGTANSNANTGFNATRTVAVTFNYNNNIFTISTWSQQ